MKIDFNQVLYDIYGKVLQQANPDPDVEGLEDLTLQSVSFNAILNNDQGMDGRTKVQRYDLALRIKQADGPIELKVDEVALIKKQVGKLMAPLVVGQVWPMLDPAEKSEKIEEASELKPKKPEPAPASA